MVKVGTLTTGAAAAAALGVNNNDAGNSGLSIRYIKDKWHLVPAFLHARGLVRQHIDSFDYFLKEDLKNIVRANSKVLSSADPMFYLKYLDVHVGTPGKDE